MSSTTRILSALLALALPAAVSSSSYAANYPHINTGGFDYDEQAIRNNAAEAQWLATHHDWVVGAQPHSSGTSFDKISELTYDRLKAGNPNVKIMGYVPFQTMMQWMQNWMEARASQRGLDPENLYCHYAVDTNVRLRDGSTKLVRGYPNGSAGSRRESRVVSSWWHGTLPNICATSSTFRTVYTDLVREAVTVNAAQRKYLDGLLLDTFEGTVDTYYGLSMQNTVEMRNLGLTAADAARRRAIDDMVSLREQLQSSVQSLIGRTAWVMPNGADIDNFYNWYTDVYNSRYSAGYDRFYVEYLITSGFNSMSRIQRLQQTYNDLTNTSRPTKYFINSQTNYTSNIPFGFVQFILATHYLINHPNAIFSYHKGTASFYGTEAGSFRNTHWHRNIEYNIGTPVTRAGTDYWGATNTNRFFVFADGGSQYKLLAREYTNALVLAKFGNVGGFANIGLNRITHQLNGTYRRLNEDNTLGPAITSISLGFGEGAILIKNGSGGGSNNPPGTPARNRRGDNQ